MSLTAAIRRVLLLRLRNEEQPPRILPGLEEQVAQLETFVGSIGASADNSSLLVVGRPGSGRRSSISYALSRVVGRKVVLWLDGSSISDDVTALHEISRQLSIDPSGEGVDAIDEGDAETRGVTSVNDEASESEGDCWGDDPLRDDAAALARARRFIAAQCPALVNAARAAARSGGGILGGPPFAKLSASGPAERAAAVSTAASAAAISLSASTDGGTAAAASLVSSVLDLAAALLPRPSRVYTSTVSSALTATASGGTDADATATAAASAIVPARAATTAPAASAGVSKRRRRPLQEEEREGESGDISAAAAAPAPTYAPAPTAVTAATLASGLAKRRRGGGAAGRSRVTVAGGGDGDGEEAGPPVLLHAPTTHRPVTGGKQVRTRDSQHHLAFAMAALREAARGGVPVFVVIDAFEAFASRQQQRQSLLYALLDVTQSSDVRVRLIGVSQAAGALDRLEKRLRSRFSHQRVVFPARLPPASFARAVSAALRLPDAGEAGPAATSWPAQAGAAWHASVRGAFGDARVRALLGAARAQGAPMGAVLRWLEVAVASLPEAPPPSAPPLELSADALLAAAAAVALPGHDDPAAAAGAAPAAASDLAAGAAAPSAAGFSGIAASAGRRAALLDALTVPEVMLLAAVAHGEQRHMTAAGDAYLIAGGGGGRGRGGAAAAASASAADGSAADGAPEAGRDAAQFAMPFEAAFQAITARFGGTMAAPARRHKATTAVATAPGMLVAAAAGGVTTAQAALGKERAALRVLDDEGGDARWLLSRTMALRAWERLLALDLLRFAGPASAPSDAGGAGNGPSVASALRTASGLRGGGGGAAAVTATAAAMGRPATADLLGTDRGAMLAAAPACAMLEPQVLAAASRCGALRSLGPFPALARWVERGGDGVQ